MSSPEGMRQRTEDQAWTALRAIAQEHGMADPAGFSERDQQLLWMGIKSGIAVTIEVVLDALAPEPQGPNPAG